MHGDGPRRAACPRDQGGVHDGHPQRSPEIQLLELPPPPAAPPSPPATKTCEPASLPSLSASRRRGHHRAPAPPTTSSSATASTPSPSSATSYDGPSAATTPDPPGPNGGEIDTAGLTAPALPTTPASGTSPRASLPSGAFRAFITAKVGSLGQIFVSEEYFPREASSFRTQASSR